MLKSLVYFGMQCNSEVRGGVQRVCVKGVCGVWEIRDISVWGEGVMSFARVSNNGICLDGIITAIIACC